MTLGRQWVAHSEWIRLHQNDPYEGRAVNKECRACSQRSGQIPHAPNETLYIM